MQEKEMKLMELQEMYETRLLAMKVTLLWLSTNNCSKQYKAEGTVFVLLDTNREVMHSPPYLHLSIRLSDCVDLFPMKLLKRVIFGFNVLHVYGSWAELSGHWMSRSAVKVNTDTLTLKVTPTLTVGLTSILDQWQFATQVPLTRIGSPLSAFQWA